MKCDELKAETVVPQGASITLQMYGKGDVDVAIAELKEALKIKDDLLIENGFEIGALKAENESLNAALNKSQDITQQCFKREVGFRRRIDELDAKIKESNAKINMLASECRALREMNIKAQEEITTLRDAQRWRKFPDEKPDDGQTVWAYAASTKRILRLEYSKNDESEGFICFPFKSDFYAHITKWMPFEKPKAPEEE